MFYEFGLLMQDSTRAPSLFVCFRYKSNSSLNKYKTNLQYNQQKIKTADYSKRNILEQTPAQQSNTTSPGTKAQGIIWDGT